MNQGLVWLIASIVVLGTLAAVWIRTMIHLKHARQWPMSQGTVESTNVEYESRGGQPGASRYVGIVAYSYSVQGDWYSGTFKREFMMQSKAEKWLAGFPSGSVLIVRCNPAKPLDSVVFENEQAKQTLPQSA